MHQVEVQNENEKIMWRGQISNNRKGFETLLEKFRIIERSNNDKIKGIFMNPTGNYHIPLHHFLESNGYKVIYVDPRVTDYARKMSNLGKEKSDTVDSAMLASAPWKNKNKELFDKNVHRKDAVSGLTRLRQSVTKNITRITNIIGSDLACVFPEFTDVFSDIGSKTSLAILDQFTTPSLIVNAGIDNVLKVMRKTSRNHYGKENAQKLLELAKESVGIPDTECIYAFRIRQNVARLISEQKHLKEIEEKILDLTKNDENIKRLDDIKGIGPMNAAAIVSEIGDIKQFESALKLQSYGGKAPMMSGSGGKNHATGISKISNSYLSNSVYESARSLVNHNNEEFVKIYEREIGKGKKKKQAYIIVARRLLYHVYSMMKNEKPYRVRLPTMKGEGETFPLDYKK
ncbi:MAG: transposase [Thermoplasmatales archaeon E-plasma]|nr:MAG: transposase [Thermoplasmatales archaeon E-plasma]EQB67267.1 MAG: transposase [Thermoplasmatales archaeon E-plasma]